MDLPHIVLRPALQLSVKVSMPVEAGQVEHALGSGQRRIIPIIGGSAHLVARGMDVRGQVLAGGADFQLIASPTTARLDARYIVRLQSGHHLYIRNLAIRSGSASDVAALARGEGVPPQRLYFRCAPTFETDHPELVWMTQTLFIGTGARYSDRVEMRFDEVL
ncbi:MAG: DUF3237 family protein [Brachymonas sp.]|nr:DUF3237 family protein [Brachymonas sp.]